MARVLQNIIHYHCALGLKNGDKSIAKASVPVSPVPMMRNNEREDMIFAMNKLGTADLAMSSPLPFTPPTYTREDS